MELDIKGIDFEANQWEVTKAIAAILHNEFPKLTPEGNPRPLNFKVTLNQRKAGGVGNSGTGQLILPSQKVGHAFLRWFRDGGRIKVRGSQLKFFCSSGRHAISPSVKMTLEKAPYIDPDIDEKREGVLYTLERQLRIDEVQFGAFYHPRGPGPPQPRAFSVEWSGNYEKTAAWLKFEYDHKLIRVQLGNDMTQVVGSRIAIPFNSINKLGIGYDFGKPFLIFDLLTPPVLEEFNFNRTLTGVEFRDSRKFRRRVGALHPGHEVVAPYAHHVRILPYHDNATEDVLRVFTNLCNEAGLRPPQSCTLEAKTLGLYSTKQLDRIRTWLKDLHWEVAFQVEILLHNGRLNSQDLLNDLRDPINTLCRELGAGAAEILRHFNQALRFSPVSETPRQCLERVRQDKSTVSTPKLVNGLFHCHHVTFTPTRLLLEGPYVIQSNRVIRRYAGFENNFIRVDFRDEDRLQFRWDREVDGTSFLEERVGGVLRGFELAGRRFEFLAYSSSALREHAVWFVSPFVHPEHGTVTSEYIRDSLGEFRTKRIQEQSAAVHNRLPRGTSFSWGLVPLGRASEQWLEEDSDEQPEDEPLQQVDGQLQDELIFQPSKYAARLAQAFTATDDSVEISEDDWEEVGDIGLKDHEFTDGCGTISRDLGDKIWSALCEKRRDQGRRGIQPSAYQIRFLGYKGVVSVDERLEGIKMHLRPSMRKFKVKNNGKAKIEIARAFDRTSTSYLNRSLVMILEDRGVLSRNFLELQESAVADAWRIDDSIEEFRTILRCHGLGNGYRLLHTMQKLNDLGLGLKPQDPTKVFDNPFLARVRNFAKNHVLRDIKHGARIPIPNSWLLVGVADEGPAYRKAGLDVYCLPAGKIFACVQQPGDEGPKWLKGSCTISRSPVVHPGDVQRVFAIGKPPEDQICLFRHLKNVVVLPSQGDRPLASCLAGGDLDGDLFDVIQEGKILPSEHVLPAIYPKGEVKKIGWETTVDDICDFIVEYINSDVLGLLSDRHLIIADQSKSGTQDPKCLDLAELCSKAVDYPKNGVPVNMDKSPRFLIPYKPDWHAAEVTNPRGMDYYESTRALGYMYRAITLEDPTVTPSLCVSFTQREPLSDPISLALIQRIKKHLPAHAVSDGNPRGIMHLFEGYVHELQYICATFTVSTGPEARLKEEEVVVGTILAKCSQKRWRKSRIYSMHVHASALVQDIQHKLLPVTKLNEATADQLTDGLERAWRAWGFSLSAHEKFGGNSFGLIALAVIFDCLEELDKTV